MGTGGRHCGGLSMSDRTNESIAAKYAHLRGGKPSPAPAVAGDMASDRKKTLAVDRRQAHLMLDLRFKDGNATALSYAYLVAVRFNPSEGLELEFTGHRVTLKGRGLSRLYRGLLAHVVGHVQEVDELADRAEENPKPTAVYSVKIEAV